MGTRRFTAMALGWFAFAAVWSARAELDYRDFEAPPHDYNHRPLKDRFSAFKARLEGGHPGWDCSTELSFVRGLLEALEISASSQLLVFSTTSLQLSRITPSTPRALYFNDDIYVGYVPGGRIEVVSVDPDLGGVFYIFDIPRGDSGVKVERSDRCMNCHAGEESKYLPGLLVKSVVPGPAGGSLMAFRQNRVGHTVPLSDRLGGWYVTGAPGFTNHWGNLMGRLTPAGLVTTALPPGERYAWDRYPVGTSDLVAHMVHEHQVGFVNRAIEATYRARTRLHESGGRLTEEHRREMEGQARELARYLLFADEAPLPAGGIAGDARFRQDFVASGRGGVEGRSLREFDLRTRLFRLRCSYMVYCQAFEGLPEVVKGRVFEVMSKALDPLNSDAEFAYLGDGERTAIARILDATLPGWKRKTGAR